MNSPTPMGRLILPLAVCLALGAGAFSCSSTRSKEKREARDRSAALDLLEEGRKFEEDGLYQQAVQRYLAAADLSPRPQIYYHLGHCYVRMREYDTAIHYLQKAVDGAPDFTLAYYELLHAEEMAASVAAAPTASSSAAGPGPREYAAPAQAPAPSLGAFQAVEAERQRAAEPKTLVFATADEFRPRAIRPPAPGAHAQSVRTRPIPESPVPVGEVAPPTWSAAADLDVVSRPPEPAELPYVDAPRPADRPPIRPLTPPREEADRWAHLVDKPLPPLGVSPDAPPPAGVASPADPDMSRVYETLFGAGGAAAAPAPGEELRPYSAPGAEGASLLGEAQFYLNTADKLMEQGEYQKAAAEYVEALRLNDRDATVRARLAEAHMRMGEPERAEAQLKRARELDPRNFEAAYRLADLYSNAGRYNEALGEAEAAWALDGQSAEAAILLGDIYAKVGREERAEGMYKRAGELQPESPRPLWKMGNLRLAVKDYNQARSLYERSVELDPKFIPGHNNLGVLAQLEGDYEASKRHFERVVSLDSHWVKAHYNLAILHEVHFNQPKEAIKHYERYLKIGGPRDAEARSAIAQLKSR